MDECRKPPVGFANRVIRRFIDNQIGDEALALPKDYMAIRVVFRRCKGSWEQVARGNIIHTHLLSKIVGAWARLRGEAQKVESI